MNKVFVVNFSFFDMKNPFDNVQDKLVSICIKEYVDNVLNQSHMLKFDFMYSWIDNGNVEWEKQQIKHYFEYEKNVFEIITNDDDLWKKLYN